MLLYLVRNNCQKKRVEWSSEVQAYIYSRGDKGVVPLTHQVANTYALKAKIVFGEQNLETTFWEHEGCMLTGVPAAEYDINQHSGFREKKYDIRINLSYNPLKKQDPIIRVKFIQESVDPIITMTELEMYTSSEENEFENTEEQTKTKKKGKMVLEIFNSDEEEEEGSVKGSKESPKVKKRRRNVKKSKKPDTDRSDEEVEIKQTRGKRLTRNK